MDPINTTGSFIPSLGSVPSDPTEQTKDVANGKSFGECEGAYAKLVKQPRNVLHTVTITEYLSSTCL